MATAACRAWADLVPRSVPELANPAPPDVDPDAAAQPAGAATVVIDVGADPDGWSPELQRPQRLPAKTQKFTRLGQDFQLGAAV